MACSETAEQSPGKIENNDTVGGKLLVGTQKTQQTISRRDLLTGMAGAAVTSSSGIHTAHATPPEATVITPALIEAARKEGKFSWYTSVNLLIAEKVAKAFQEKFPGVGVRVERTGAERNFQRVGQEIEAKIFACDVVESSDASHFIIWKRDGLLAPHIPEDVARHYAPQFQDPEGTYAIWRVSLSVMGYNTTLVKAQDAPKSFADLLDPKWSGKIVKAHPGYSGTIMTATQQMARDLGWSYFEKLAKQKVMQVQSAGDPPKKLALGERVIMADGTNHTATIFKERGDPIEIIYPSEGSPMMAGPVAIMKTAPNPNAARLFHCWMFTKEAQQLNVDVGRLFSAHPLVTERPGRVPLKDIKTMREDPVAVVEQAEEIKARYTKLFKV